MTKPIPTMSERLRQIERKALAAAEAAVDVGDLAKAASALVVLDSARNNRGNEEHIPFAPGPYEPRAAFTYNGPRTVEAFDAPSTTRSTSTSSRRSSRFPPPSKVAIMVDDARIREIVREELRVQGGSAPRRVLTFAFDLDWPDIPARGETGTMNEPQPPPFTPAQEARLRELVEQTLVAELTRQEEWTRLEIQRSAVDLAQRLLDAVASPARLPTIETMMRMRDVYARHGLRPSWDEHGRVLTFPIPPGEDPFSCEPLVVEGRFGGWRKTQPPAPSAA